MWLAVTKKYGLGQEVEYSAEPVLKGLLSSPSLTFEIIFCGSEHPVPFQSVGDRERSVSVITLVTTQLKYACSGSMCM